MTVLSVLGKEGRSNVTVLGCGGLNAQAQVRTWARSGRQARLEARALASVGEAEPSGGRGR